MAYYSVLNLISRSLRRLLVLAEGDSPSAKQEQDGLEALNGLVDACATESLLIYESVRNVVSLAPNQAAYEIGPNAADWKIPRPPLLDGAGVLVAGANGIPVELPVRVLTRAEWRGLAVKTLVAGASFVTKIYYDRGYSNPNSAATDIGSGLVNVYPVPSASGQLVLYCPTAVAEFVSVNQNVSLPPGYRRFLTCSLALELAPEYGAEATELLVTQAQESKEQIQRANVRLDELALDPAISGAPAQRFNIYTGE